MLCILRPEGSFYITSKWFSLLPVRVRPLIPTFHGTPLKGLRLPKTNQEPPHGTFSLIELHRMGPAVKLLEAQGMGNLQ